MENNKIKINSSTGQIEIDGKQLERVREISFKIGQATKGIGKVGEITIKMDAEIELEGQIVLLGELLEKPDKQ